MSLIPEITDEEVQAWVEALSLDKWRLVTLELAGKTFCFAAPNDGRALDDLTLRDLRPWPAMDATIALQRIFNSQR